MEYIVVSITVFLYLYLRTNTTCAVINKDLIKGSLYTAVLQLLWVIQAYVGTKALILGPNPIGMGIIYIIFGMLGFIAAMTQNKYRGRVQIKFKK